MSVSFSGRTERVDGELVSGNYFQALGVKPVIGRLFTPQEDDQVYKGHPVAVLSYQYWMARFGGDKSVIGQKMIIDDYPMTIVGVSAPGFTGLDPARSPQVRVPIQMKPLMTPGWDALGDRRSQWIQMFARMKPGYTVQSATASLQPLFIQILRDELTRPELREASAYNRDQFLKRQVKMEQAANGYSQMRRDYGTALVVLMCMVGLVLLIACFNVANLLIARAVARQKEVAVRLAVGASKWQLIRQLLIESLVLSAAGGAAGLFFAMAMLRGMLHFLPNDGAPLMLKTDPDMRVLAFNGALAVLTGLLFGLAPALQAMRVDLWNTLKDVVGTVSGGGSGVRLRKTLVIAQVAFSFLLLVGSGLFVRTLVNLKQKNSGFHDIDNLVSFQVDPALNGYSIVRIKGFYERLLENLRATPGVKSAGYAMVPLLSGGEWDSTMGVEGHESKDGEDMQAFMNAISTDYWKTMGVRLIEGRDFTAHDAGKDVTVAIVNEKFARHFFGGRSAMGRHIGFGGPQGEQTADRDRGGRGGYPVRRTAGGYAPAGLRPPAAVRLPGRGGLLCAHGDRFGKHVQYPAAAGAGARRGPAGVRVEDAGTAAGRHAIHGAPDRGPLGGLRAAGDGAGRARLVRSYGIRGGAADQGDRAAHGPGRAAARGGVDGDAGDADAGGDRPCHRRARGIGGRKVRVEAVVRGAAGGSGVGGSGPGDSGGGGGVRRSLAGAAGEHD